MDLVNYIKQKHKNKMPEDTTENLKHIKIQNKKLSFFIFGKNGENFCQQNRSQNKYHSFKDIE